MNNNNLNQPEEKTYKLSDFPLIHQKYSDLCKSDSDDYIQIEERIKADCEMYAKIIDPLKEKNNPNWADYDNIISNDLEHFAEEGFINGYLQAKKDNGYTSELLLSIFDDLGLLEEDIRKGQIIAQELQDYFNEDITAEEQRKLVLYDFKNQKVKNYITLDYIDKAFAYIKELRKEIGKAINKKPFTVL